MSYEPQLLAPIQGGGLVEYYKPWLIGRDAFTRLEDAYCWRGTVKKREGYDRLDDETNPTSLPSGPVQGLLTYNVPNQGTIQLIAFNLTKAYLFNNTTKNFEDISFFSDATPISWTGTDTDFFYGSNFANSLWVTNYVDPLAFWNGDSAQGWSYQKPLVNAVDRLQRCLMVFPYRGRLLLLSTVENGVFFEQRARWAQIGTPYVDAVGGDPATDPPINFAIDNDAWRDDIPGKGGFIDADTTERIVAAGIVRDTLIVRFQRSTWRLRYTGNEVLPFLWERINTQYGSDSTFGTIPFDEDILDFSRFGFTRADTNGVQRIDEKIPDQTFQNMELGATPATCQRVHGIRDFYRQTAYWCYPDAAENATYPNKVLAYNYLDKTWARYNQSFTCFGYYQSTNDLKWEDLDTPPENFWQNMSIQWRAPYTQQGFPQVVAGDRNGNVYTVYDVVANSLDGDDPFGFIIDTKFMNPYIGEGARCRLQYMDLYIDKTESGEITVEHYIDDNLDTPIKTYRVTTSQVYGNSRYVRVFLGATARVHMLRFTLSQTQLDNDEVNSETFVIQGIVLWTRKEGRLKR